MFGGGAKPIGGGALPPPQAPMVATALLYSNQQVLKIFFKILLKFLKIFLRFSSKITQFSLEFVSNVFQILTENFNKF